MPAEHRRGPGCGRRRELRRERRRRRRSEPDDRRRLRRRPRRLADDGGGGARGTRPPARPSSSRPAARAATRSPMPARPGTVGPNLDDAKPDAALVKERVTNGKGVDAVRSRASSTRPRSRTSRPTSRASPASSPGDRHGRPAGDGRLATRVRRRSTCVTGTSKRRAGGLDDACARASATRPRAWCVEITISSASKRRSASSSACSGSPSPISPRALIPAARSSLQRRLELLGGIAGAVLVGRQRPAAGS